MVGYMSLEEQVDKDFTLARRKAWLRRIGDRLRRGAAPEGLLCFEETRKIPGAVRRVHRGRRTVPLGQIAGSVGRCSDFDRDFLPVKASVGTKWERIDRAFHRGEELPPVSLYKRDVERPTRQRQPDRGSRRGGPKLHEMMDFEVWKQRREEMLREAEQNRLAKALRDSRKQHSTGRASSLVWELHRAVGLLRKLLRSLNSGE